MEKQDLIKLASEFVEGSQYNRIAPETAISEEVIGLKIFEEPIFGFGATDDDLFKQFKDPSIIGDHFLLPTEWLPESKTVVSFFLPFTEAVRKSNRKDMAWPSHEWLHGRIEGQSFINKLCEYLSLQLNNAGYKSLVPSLDERFKSRTNGEFTSNWSERHIAFVCGLGSFGLSKGLITKKGIAGRFGSLVTELELKPSAREYHDVYEYCTMCGLCVRNCPVNAITIEEGKNHAICSDFLDKTAEKFKPRYGCGKCQIQLPCETRIPLSK